MLTQIANPIYDVVFKFMLEDLEAAKVFLSAFVGAEITNLRPMAQEMSVELDKENSKKKSKPQSIQSKTGLSVYRLDYAAQIKTDKGEKVIIIEVQKTKFRSDMMRFRSYLGKQYMRADLFYWIVNQQSHHKAGMPIFPIFILGEGLEEYRGVPVLRIDKCLKDNHTHERLESKGAFVESLFHEGMIVNVPDLSGHKRDELEKVLAIFDQSQVDESNHIMTINEQDFEPRYTPLIRRLHAAVVNTKLRSKMQAEDLILSDLAEIERETEAAKKAFAQAKAQAEEAEAKAQKAEAKAQEAQAKAQEAQAQAQKAETKAQEAETKAQKAQAQVEEVRAKALEAQTKAEMERLEKEKAQNQADAERLEKEKAYNNLYNSIKMMLAAGIGKGAIATSLGLSLKELDKIEKGL